jgi:hypothetical protein
MPERAESLASAFIAGTLALAALLGVNTTASAAAECLESPDLHVTQPGHWSYRTDRSLNQRCWHFDPTEATAATATTQAAAPATATARAVGPATATARAVAPAAAASEDSQQSFFDRLAAGLSQTLSPPPQPHQNSIPDNSGEALQTISPKSAKPAGTVRREQPKAAPPSTTDGAAIVERRDQSRQPAAEKDEKRDPPTNVAEREALFQDFVKWQTERTMFGRP